MHDGLAFAPVIPVQYIASNGRSKVIMLCRGNELEIYCEVPERPWQEQETLIVADPLDLEAVSGD